jgi:PAS domain S-box-containing protein
VATVLSGTPVHFEAELPYERWGTRYVKAAYTPRTDEGGRVIGFVAAIMDITDRHAVETALKASESRLRRAQQAAHLGTWDWDLRTNKVDWSEGIDHLLGLEAGSVKPSLDNWLAHIVPEDRAPAQARLHEIIQSSDEFSLEFRVQTAGGVRWLASIGRVERDANGLPQCLLGVNIDITDRKESEELQRQVDQRLRGSEDRFRTFFESLDQGFCLIELETREDGRTDYRFIEINRAFAAQTGLKDALGRRVRDLVPNHEEHWFEKYDRVARSGRAERFIDEARALGRWYDVYAARVGGPESRTVAVLFQDITHQRQSQARNQLLLALEDGTRTLENPDEITQAAARLLGEHLGVNRCAYADVEADENTFNLTGDHNVGVPSIVGRYRFDQFGDECLRLMRSSQPFVVTDSETDPRCAGVIESYRMTRIRSVICVPLHKGGRFVAAMAVHAVMPRQWRPHEVEVVQSVAARCWESIERARVARDLRASEFRYRAFIANSSEGIWRLEIDPPLDTSLPLEEQVDYVYQHAKFAECNDVMARMYGFESPADLIGKGLEMMLPPTDLRAREYIGFVLQSGYRLTDAESEELDMNGNTVFFSNSMVGVVENGRLLRVWGTQRDITAKRAAEEELASYRDRLEVMVQERTMQLEAASKRLRDSERLASLGTLAAGLGHDLHNALLPLRVHVEELESTSHDVKVRQNASAISAVVGYLSELSRGMRMIAMDPSQEGPGSTDPAQWQADAGRIFQSGVGRGIEVTTRARPGCPPLAIAPHRLTQAVFNLVQNARDAILQARGEGQGGRIEINAHALPDFRLVEVTVSDNGPGMTEDVRRRCMEPFFTTRTRSAGRGGSGTGMGLSIVAGIIAAAGGRVEVESVRGRGSTFRLLIPALLTQESARTVDRPRAGLRVQDARQRAFVAALLTASGWDVDTAGDGEARHHRLLVADAASSEPEEVRGFAQPPRRVLVLGVEPGDHRFDGPGVLVHHRGQPLTGVRTLIRQITAQLSKAE